MWTISKKFKEIKMEKFFRRVDMKINVWIVRIYWKVFGWRWSWTCSKASRVQEHFKHWHHFRTPSTSRALDFLTSFFTFPLFSKHTEFKLIIYVIFGDFFLFFLFVHKILSWLRLSDVSSSFPSQFDRKSVDRTSSLSLQPGLFKLPKMLAFDYDFMHRITVLAWPSTIKQSLSHSFFSQFGLSTLKFIFK